MASTRFTGFALAAALVVYVALVVPADVCAQCQVDKATASAGNANAGDQFGWSVAVNGNYVVVGADVADGGGSNPQADSGAAFLLKRDGLNWVEIQELVANDTLSGAGDEFGASVAISDNAEFIVVGAIKATGKLSVTRAGAVYVFKRYQDSFPCAGNQDCTGVGLATCTDGACEGLTWAIETKLLADDPNTGDDFGFSVDISGDVVVVGAWRADNGFSPPSPGDAGAAYVFRRYQNSFPCQSIVDCQEVGLAVCVFEQGACEGVIWLQEQRLTSSEAGEQEFFGNAVSIEANRIAVGAKGLAGPGGAYIFEYNGTTWQETQKLMASDGLDFDAFGQAVDLHRDSMVVTAMNADPAGVPNAGKAYVYLRIGDTYGDERILTAGNPASSDRFGRSTSLHGDNLLIGARDTDVPASRAGSTYLFSFDGTDWNEIEEIRAADGAGDDRFGHAVSLSETYGIVGAYRNDDDGGDSGSAYVFAVGLGRDCNANLVPDDCDVIAGTEPDVNNNGTPDACECQGDVDCPGSDACSIAVCNQESLCELAIDAGRCCVDGVGYQDGEANPNNACQACNASVDQEGFTPVVGAPPCEDDGKECTLDVCLSGFCHHRFIEGCACGDPTTTVCSRPDTLNGEGVCDANDLPAGTVCAINSDPCKSNVCDGAGSCVEVDVREGTACPSDGNPCTDNVCDGAGNCGAIDLPEGTVCLDSGNPCTANVCDGGGSCGGIALPAGTVCPDDGNPCTDSLCDGAGRCGVNLPEGTACPGGEFPCLDDFCDGAGICGLNDLPDGIVCPDDGNPCTDDLCDRGVCDHPPLAEGTACGDTADTECDNPDSCSSNGVCSPNFETPGATCTAPEIGNDTGDPDCDLSNTCNESGKCLANLLPNGESCADRVRCDGEEYCWSGTCRAGSAPCNNCLEDPGQDGFICICGSHADCVDGIDCTSQTCNIVTGNCENFVIAGFCAIGTTCAEDGSDNPANECEVCDTTRSKVAWSPKSNGSACADDEYECTDDVCDGAGLCQYVDDGSNACEGTVKSYQKISRLSGGFPGILGRLDGFGIAVTSLGDLDADGVVDLAVGAVGDDDGGSSRGAVWVLFLKTDGTLKSHQKISDTQGGFTGKLDDYDNFGRSLVSLGDLDGDGVRDLAVGAYADDDGGSGHGAVWVLFLKVNGTVKSHQKISDTQGGFEGSLRSGDWFGASVASLGDLDGDGIVDLAVGAFGDDSGGSYRGAVWVLFLNTDGTVKTYQKISDLAGRFTGVLDTNDSFGSSVASLGDVDGDAVGDLAVGAIGDDDGGDARGAVWVLFLNTDGSVKAHQKISQSEGGFTGALGDSDRFGDSLASLGDLDGDGVGDLAVGASGDDDGGSAHGAVWVVFLNTDGRVRLQRKISDTHADFAGTLNVRDAFGTSVASLGDLDGDGTIDLAVGADGDDDGGEDRGAVWVLFLDDAPYECAGVSDGTSCTDDRLACTGEEVCRDGWCVSSRDPCPALGLVCDEEQSDSSVIVCGCNGDNDCEDEEPCTEDVCNDGECQNNEIPGCRNGACCFSVACLDFVSPSDCELISGTYLGPGITCTGDPDSDNVHGCDDGCPIDGNKAEPGVCGCGVPDTDTDEDNIMDCNDACPELFGIIELNGCPLLGACCFEVGVCLENRDPQDCAAAEALFQGNGSACDDGCGVRPDPAIVQPAVGVTTVHSGDTVPISFNAGNDDDNVQWRLFYLTENDPTDVPAGELGTQLMIGSGNLGSFDWDTSAVSDGSYRLGLSVTDSGLSVAQSISSGFAHLIVTIPNDSASTPTVSIDPSCVSLQAFWPPNCAIDARQPSTLDGLTPQGWIAMDVKVGPTGCTLIKDDLLVGSVPIGPAPTVSNVSQAGTVATVTFGSIMPQRNWTCVSLAAHPSQQVCLGNLAGDVNSDGTSSPAIDLGTLIDCVNAPGSCLDFQANIDRTGLIPGVLDITRLVDLLNGAAEYDSWTGASFGGLTCPSD